MDQIAVVVGPDQIRNVFAAAGGWRMMRPVTGEQWSRAGRFNPRFALFRRNSEKKVSVTFWKKKFQLLGCVIETVGKLNKILFCYKLFMKFLPLLKHMIYIYLLQKIIKLLSLNQNLFIEMKENSMVITNSSVIQFVSFDL